LRTDRHSGNNICRSHPATGLETGTGDWKRGRSYLLILAASPFLLLQVERIDQAIPTVTYPRVIRRVGKSPPQSGEE